RRRRGGRPACRLWQRRRTRGRARRENPCSLGSAPDRWRRCRPTTPAPVPRPLAAPVPDTPPAHARRRRGRELSSLLTVPVFSKNTDELSASPARLSCCPANLSQSKRGWDEKIGLLTKLRLKPSISDV